MRIGILGTCWPYRGGLSAFNERLARQFMSEGHEVELFTFTMQYPDFLFPGKTQYSDAPQPADLSITRTMNSIEPISWFRTVKLLKQKRIEMLVIKFWIPLMAPCLGTIARLARREGIRVVSILDNVIPHEPHFWDKLLIRYFIGSVDRFVAMSESVQRDCRIFLPESRKDDVLLSPHPLYDNFGESIDKAEARKALDLPKDKTLLLFFGFIRDYKGLDLLMKSYAKVNSEDQLRLVVAGEFYNNGEQYKELERELGLEGKIIWRTDFIPDDKVRYYFSAADMVVQPYKSATQSGVTQIAYHFEKPMLVTNVGGLAEIVPDGKVGYVCEVDADSIAAAITKFAEMPADKRESHFIKNIKKEKEKYGWSKMTAKLYDYTK
ncbi:MAG: glycosyltransferase [Paludibacteraceae bacterium]|nr:glycosyltransferase [Paludibacteraceae bacterium]MBP5641561.1 glycosyltransferase [Paludibacteraceae bacterium]